MIRQLVQTNDAPKEDEGDIDDTGVDDDNVRVDDYDEDDDGPPSFEKVLEHLGVPGRFQVIQVVLSHATTLTCAFMALSIVFTGYVPNHECRVVNETQLINRHLLEMGGNETTSVSAHVTYDECDVRVTLTSNESINSHENIDQPKRSIHSLSCPNGRDFFDAKDTTYVSEWDLVCESKGMSEFTQTVFTIGQVVGGLIASPMSDYFGRKPVVVVSACMCCLIEIAHILSPNIYIVYVVKVISGLFYQAAITSVYIFSVEFMVPRHRQTLAILGAVVWISYVIVVGGVAYFVRNNSWRYFHGVSVACGLVAFLTPFVLKESPRWLAANGKYEESLDVIKHMCKTNGKDFEIAKQKFNSFVSYKYSLGNEMNVPLVSPVRGDNAESDKVDTNDRESPSMSDTTLIASSSAQKKSNEEKSSGSKSSSFAMLLNKRILMLLVAGCYLWLTNVLVYYGLLISSSVLAGNRFLNFIIMDLVEILSLVLAFYLLKIIGRRIVLGIFIGSAGFCLMVSALMSTVGDGLPGSGIANTVMFFLGKFSISASFTMLYVITPELFPTNVRTTAHGYCSAFGRLGNMVSPYMNLLHSEVKWGPALLFTVMCCLAVVVTFFLPETRNTDLPSTLEDVMNHGNEGVVNTQNGNKRNK